MWFTNEIQRKTYLRHRDKLGGSLGCVLASTAAAFHISLIVSKNASIFEFLLTELILVVKTASD